MAVEIFSSSPRDLGSIAKEIIGSGHTIVGYVIGDDLSAGGSSPPEDDIPTQEATDEAEM